MKINNFDNFPQFNQFKSYLRKNVIIAGGCFKDILLGRQLRDIDLFFRNQADFENERKFYDMSKLFKCIYSNEKAIGFINIETNIKIDLVRSIFQNPESTISAFDFTVSKMCLYIDIELTNSIMLLHHNDFFEHLHLNRLVIDDKIPFPISTFQRVLKYTKYGFNLCRESKIKIIQALQNSKDEKISDSLYDGGFD